MTTLSAIAMLETVVSGNVSDAMEHLNLPRQVLLGFRHLALGNRPIVGPAYTIRQTWKAKSMPRDMQLVRHGEVTRGLARAGEIIVIATGGILSVATWGENHSMRCLSLGVRGLITDGATRDAALVEQRGLPVLCRGASPVKSRWDLHTVSLGEQVQIDGVPIEPGDLIFADETGVIVIPAEKALAVATLALNIRQQEESYQDSFQ